MSGKTDKTDNLLTAGGQLYAPQGTTTGAQVGPTGPRRCVAIMAISGTGTVELYDGVDNTGNVIFPAIAMVPGTRYPVDTPCTVGIFAVVGASTTVNIIYT